MLRHEAASTENAERNEQQIIKRPFNAEEFKHSSSRTGDAKSAEKYTSINGALLKQALRKLRALTPEQRDIATERIRAAFPERIFYQGPAYGGEEENIADRK
jgi:hypothetical protein